MLRSEGRWFTHFLRLVDLKRAHLSPDHPDQEILARIMGCDSYRRVYPLLRGKDMKFLFEIFHLRHLARLITGAYRLRHCYYYWHLHHRGMLSGFLFPHAV